MDGVSFQDLSESEYVQIMQDNVTSFTERLNFSARDWHKLVSCARSVKHVLGGASGAYDEEALEEVGEDDQNVDNAGAVLGGRDVYPPRHVYQPLTTEASSQPRVVYPPPSTSSQPRPPSSQPPSPSSSSSSPKPQHKARPSVARQVPSSEHVQQPAESPEVPPPPPPPWRQLEEASPPGMSGCRGVKRPYEELAEPLSIIVSGMCPLCKVPRAECFRPGDWGCPVCGQHNYPSKLVCSNYRCLAKKGVAVLCAPTPQAPPPVGPPVPSSWCDSCRRPRSECWRPNDWECPWCKNHNYARKQVVAAECSAGWEWVCL